MTLLSRDAILAADDLETEDVPVPEWGGTVRVRALTGTEVDAYQTSMRQQRGNSFVPNLANLRAKLVARSVIGEDGKLMFSDRDVVALGAKSAGALTRVFEVAARLSRISDDDVDELGKDSAPDLNGDSTSS